MEDSTTSFFINGLKIHIESSLTKFKEYKNLIYDFDFENLIINPIFINNINLFREIIIKNNLNFKIFWSHISKIINSSIQPLIKDFQDEIDQRKEIINNKQISDDNKEKNLFEIGEINLLKLKIINICLNLLVNEDFYNNNSNKEVNTEKFKNLLEKYFQIEIKNNIDFSLFIKNYIILISLLINNNGKEINTAFLKYLSNLFFNFEASLNMNGLLKNLHVYINQIINNPKWALNIYLNGPINKKNNIKERICRSRGASFDYREININGNNSEKKNKKINDYFKTIPKKEKGDENKENIIKEKNNINQKTELLKENKNFNVILNNNNKELINKEENIKNNKEILKKFLSNESNKSLFNIDSYISKNSNSNFLSNSLSFLKNNNINDNNCNLNDSLEISKIFSTPLSELNENKNNKENRENRKIPLRYPTFIRCLKTKKRKPLEKLRNILFNSQMNIKRYIKVENKSKIENKKIKELRKIINFDFYGKGIQDKKEDFIQSNKKYENLDLDRVKDEKIIINIEDKKNNKDNILISKTPNKNMYINQENRDFNIEENENLNKIKKSWKLLFTQNTNLFHK